MSKDAMFNIHEWYREWILNTIPMYSGMDNQSYLSLRASEWSHEFEELMRNRLVMGALRYGRIGESDKPQYDRVKEICKRANKYHQTGNTEYLVDIANMAMLEFVEGLHPNKHFASVDDGAHTEEVRG